LSLNASCNVSDGVNVQPGPTEDEYGFSNDSWCCRADTSDWSDVAAVAGATTEGFDASDAGKAAACLAITQMPHSTATNGAMPWQVSAAPVCLERPVAPRMCGQDV
jgi:hypothetical protein